MHRFLLLGVWVWSALTAQAKPTIYIYNGPGAAADGVTFLRDELAREAGDYAIMTLDERSFFDQHWEDDAALFILPGGADLPYKKILDGEGNRRIRDYVEKGGSFLGLCAGAYFAGNEVEFGLTDWVWMRVRGSRELAFYPGVVRGPMLAHYRYGSQSGARAAQLTWEIREKEGQFAWSYFNGGGYFSNHQESNPCSVAARYTEKPHDEPQWEGSFPPAIVVCPVGAGKAILSGVHFEYNPHRFPDTEELSPLTETLLNHEAERLALLRWILGELGVTQNP